MARLARLAGVAVALIPAWVCRAQTLPTTRVNVEAESIKDTQPTVLPPSTRIRVNRFEFKGNTQFESEELAAIVDAALKKVEPGWPGNRYLTPEDLEEARLAVTRFYVDKGYINSGAVIPEQPADKGAIVFNIEEGKITDVHVTFRDGKGPANRHLLRERYVIVRLQYASGPPLNILRLKDELEILRQDPNIKTINAELKPGAGPGEGILDVQVEENNPFQLGFQFSNRRPPSVGSTAADIFVSDSDVTGHGDTLYARYDVLNGSPQDLRLDGAKDFTLSYTIPITPADTTFTADFTRTSTIVEEQNFQRLNINSLSDSISLTVRQPVYRKPTADPGGPGKAASPSVEFDVFLTGSLRNNKTNLLGRPFGFGTGDQNGSEHVTAIRFGQELTLRSDRSALSGRSTFNLGVPWFDSTPQIASGRPGGRFFDWVGQLQYVQLLPHTRLLTDTDIQLVVRGTAQLSDRPLLTLEQFSLGGVDTVRGYPENFLLRDNALIGAVELRVPVLKKGDLEVALVPFFDAGYGWNRVHSARQTEAIDAVGIGVTVNATRHMAAQFYYGSALQHHATDSHDVENLGFHFNLVLLAF
jgi:hemolysin activation/secretion protein